MSHPTPLISATATILALLSGCAHQHPSEKAATDFAQARLEFACDRAWALLAKAARAEGKASFLARCEEGSDSRFQRDLLRLTAMKVVNVRKSDDAKRTIVVVRFDSPDPKPAFEAAFRSEVTKIGDDVRNALGGGDRAPAVVPEIGDESPPLSDPKSDDWMADEIAKPGAPRMKVDHAFELVYEGGAWRVEVDALSVEKSGDRR